MGSVVKDVQETLEGLRKQVISSVDWGIKSVSTTAVSAQDEANKLMDKSKELSTIVSDEAKALESTAISHLREGVRAVAAHHPASTVALSGIALLAFAPTRRLLYRMTLARFRSEEGVFRSAEVRLKALQDGTSQSAMEARKLEERLAAAQQEYARGLSKLKGTGQQLLALSKGLRVVERNTDALLGDLRQLPSKAALQLRSEAAAVAAAAKQQRASVERHVNTLLKQGLV